MDGLRWERIFYIKKLAGEVDLNNSISSLIHEILTQKAHECLPKGNLVNVGTLLYPKEMCSPCAHARRQMFLANKESAATADTFKQVEKNFPHKIKELVRATRVKPPGEDARIPGVNSIGEQTALRTGMLGEAKSKIVTNSGVRVDCTILKLTKKAFIAHHKMYFGESHDEANNFTCHLYLHPMTPSNTIVNLS